MSRFEVVHGDDVPYADGHPRPHCAVRGGVRSKLVSPAGDHPLWLVRAELEAGASLRLEGDHGDEAIYVVDGSIEVDAGSCPTRGAVVVEAGATVEVGAPAGASIVHVGPASPVQPQDGPNGAPAPSPRGTHLVGTSGLYGIDAGPRSSRLFADGSCPTCRIWFMYTSRTEGYRAESHRHTQDELIHLLWGEMQVGRHTITPGTTVAVPADYRYGFRAPAAGFGFLNYRPDLSSYAAAPGDHGRLETGEMLGLVPTA